MINMNMQDAYQQQEENQGSYEVIPASNYPVVIENAEYKQFGSGTWGVNVQLSIFSHEKYDNRKLFDTFVLFEADGVTEKVSQDKRSGTMKNFGKIGYAGLCSAAGLTPEQASNPDNLLGKTVTVKTKVQTKNDGSGEKEAKPSYYKAMAVAGAAQPQQQQQSQGGFGQQQQAQQQPQQNQGGFGQPQQNNAFTRN